MSKIRRQFVWLTIFSISFAFMETSVVVYLREMLYPQGFQFPLAPMEPHLVLTEVFRETSTLIILLSVGIITGRNFSTRFGWFLYCFAVWDLFYYVFLKVLLNWPESLMTWDILFMIPVTWVGPVISPIIVSLTMILFALLIVYLDRKHGGVRMPGLSWLLLILGSVVLVVGFTWDYSSYILSNYDFPEIWTLPGKELHDLAINYIPDRFPWIIFITGLLVIWAGILFFWKKNK